MVKVLLQLGPRTLLKQKPCVSYIYAIILFNEFVSRRPSSIVVAFPSYILKFANTVTRYGSVFLFVNLILHDTASIKKPCILTYISFCLFNSFSVSGNHSGLTHDATAFVGCSPNQVTTCLGTSQRVYPYRSSSISLNRTKSRPMVSSISDIFGFTFPIGQITEVLTLEEYL
jgi:hypothetical protein